jgi:hypothetical protein
VFGALLQPGWLVQLLQLEKDKSKRLRKGDAVLSLALDQFAWLLRGLDIEKLKPTLKDIFYRSTAPHKIAGVVLKYGYDHTP